MKLVTLDFETYYDKDYSLSKMTMESYIRDPRFEVIGYGISIDGEPATWHTGDSNKIRKSLDSPEWWRDKALVAHNTAFDGAILAWHFGIVPKLYIDTLSMARPKHGLTIGVSLKALADYYGIGQKGFEVLDAKGKRRADFSQAELAAYGNYCANDVTLTVKLFKILAKGFPAAELKVIDMMIRMFTDPVLKFDKQILVDHYKDVVNRRQDTLRAVASEMPEAVADGIESGDIEAAIQRVLNSNPKFAEILRRFDCEPPMKISKTTGKPTYAFAKNDVEFKELLEYPDERVQAVVAARLGTKSTIEESRTKAFMRIAQRGTLPILLQYYGGHTGRACLTGDTEITVLRGDRYAHVELRDLLSDDLVWDGFSFVQHGGLIDQGIREVIYYDDVMGTPDHRVSCVEVDGWVALQEAMERKYTLTAAGAVRLREPQTPRAVDRVYDIKDCGPRNCFVANGRLVHNSGGDGVNLQNLPRKGALRRAIRAPEGFKLVVGDSSQIEARMNAWYSGQDDLVAAFAKGDDIYSLFATDVYGYEVTKENTTERHVGKTSILGLGFGMGAEKFQHSLKTGIVSVDMDLARCKEVVSLYRYKYDRIKANWKVCEGMLFDILAGREVDYGCVHTSEQGIHLPNGMLVRYPGLHQTDDGFVYTNRNKPVKIYGGKVVENLIQALARIVVFDQMLVLGARYKVAMTVHDEVCMVVPENEVDEAETWMEKVMSVAPGWAVGLPVACEVSSAYAYGEAK